jgi:hypothetical protein
MNKDLNIEKPYTIYGVSGSFLLRLLLSPLLFLWGIFMLAAGTLFPLPLLVIFSVGGMISIPFVWALRKSGAKINYIEPFLCDYKDFEKEKNIFRDHFLMASIYLWGAFYVAYIYIKTGEIYNPE